MRPTWRAAVTVVVIAASSLVAACTPAPTPDPAGAGRAAGASWLAQQFDPTSHLIPSVSPPTPDYANSAYAISNLAYEQVSPQVRADALSALSTSVDAAVEDSGGADLPGSLARLIIADVAQGGNPRSFGGTDLVARLEATMQTTGPNAGLFGSQDATYDGAFRQGLSLAALSLVSPKPASINPGSGSIASLPAVNWLLTQQCADGSWMPERTDLTQACAFDPTTFAGPDTNSTALAILGLQAVGATATVNPLTWLTSIRDADGGWSYDGAPTSSSDPDSTGLVIAAERALGQKPDAAAITELRSFQFGSSSPASERGAFFYPPFSGPPVPNLLATNDAMIGLAPGVWPAVVRS